MTFNLKTSRQAFDDVIDRVRALLSDNDPSSDDFFDLMEHVRQFIVVAQDDLKKLEEVMRSPLAGREEHDAARELHSAVRSDLDRLVASQELLEARAEELMELESRQSSKDVYDAIRQRSFATANRIETEWPKLIAMHENLCRAINRCNAEVDRINADLPDDCAPIDRPEGIARGFMDRGSYELPASLDTFRIVQSILPGMAPNSVAWPPHFDYKLHVRDVRRGFTLQEIKARKAANERKGGL